MQDKKRLVKKMLGGLLTVSMIFGLMPGTVKMTEAADLTTGILYVGGEDIVADSDHTIDDESGGTAVLSYENSNPVLTLTNFNYSGIGYTSSGVSLKYNGAIFFDWVQDATLTIRLVGENSLERTAGDTANQYFAAITSRRPIEFEGSGSLVAQNSAESTSGDHGNFGIYTEGGITINGGRITASASQGNWSMGIYSMGGTITVNDGTVVATGGEAYNEYSSGLYGSKIIIAGGKVTGKARGATYSSAGLYSQGSITINDSEVWAESDAFPLDDDLDFGGIRGDSNSTIAIGSNVYVEATGNKALIGNTTNEVAGTGWIDVNMEEGQGTEIPVSTTATAYKYRAVRFDHLHKHNFAYSSDGATITATCDDLDNCPLTDGKATITLVEPKKTKYNDGESELATITGDTGVLGTPDIVYKKGTNKLDAAPTEPGTYTASITVGEATATVEYTIDKAKPDCSEPTNTLVARYGDTLSTVELPANWSWKTPSTKITATGEQRFTAIYTPENTNLYETVEMLLTVKVDRADNPAVVETTATVTKGGRTVDLSKNVDTKDAGGEVSYSIYSAEDLGCTVNPETGEFKSGNEAGEVEVQVSVGGDGHYYATSKTITVTITDKENQTLEFASDNVSKTYGDAAFTNALSGAKTAVTYEVTDGKDVADVDSTGKVTIKKIGEAVITATAAETDAYTAATESYTVKVIRKSITVKADDKEIEIGDPEPELTATVTGLVGTDTVEYEIERETGNSLGKYTITPFGDEEQGNYKVTYATGILTIKEGEKYIRKPVIKTISSDMIAVETVEGYVYGISDSDDYPDEWTAEGVFTDLDENTEYTVFMKLNGEGDDKSTSTKVVTNEKGKETVIEEEHRAVGNGFVRTEVRINRDAIVGKIENLTPDMISSFFGESSEIINKVKNGSTLLVYLKVENADESVPEDDKKKIEDTAKDNSNAIIAQYLDLSLYMQIDDNEPELISNLNSNKILVRINIPEQFRGDSLSNDMDVEEASQSDNRRSLSTDRKYYIARVHDGETDILDTTVDGDDITFETDRFSTYALLYSDSTVDPTVEPGTDKKQSETGLILVVKNKSNISNLFSKYGESGYKYKFRVEDRSQRKIMTVSRKGKIRVKKVGTATVALYRKVKRGSWSKIEEQTLTSEMPDLPKKVTNLKVGDKVYAESFITNKMVNKPMSYKSSRPSVASIDSNTGLITVNKTGTTRISIIYGNGKGAAQYKVRLKIQ